MVDIVSPEVRSRMMAGIRGKDTRPEILLRKALHARGLRYRTGVRRLPGSPDIVLARWRTIVFVHGCFWHRHAGCTRTTVPKTRPEFWSAKFEANIARDARNEAALLDNGWRVAVVWECRIGRVLQQELADDVAAFIRAETPDRTEFG